MLKLCCVKPPVELIKAAPGATAGETFDELPKRPIAQTLGAVEHDALLAARLGQVLHRLRLAGPRWTLHASPLDVVEGDGEDEEALLGEGGHHQPLVAAKILVPVLKVALNHPEHFLKYVSHIKLIHPCTQNNFLPDHKVANPCLVLPVVAKLGLPEEIFMSHHRVFLKCPED